jgi:DNA-binding transcriptional regulator YiaG
MTTMLLRYADPAETNTQPLHYPQCGLDDVYLMNGYTIENTEDGPVLSVRNLDSLHKVIGQYLATEKKVLNGKEIRYLRKHMDLTQAELGRLLRVSDQQVARWEKEQSAMPGPADGLLRSLYIEGICEKGVKVRRLLEALEEFDAPVKERQVFAPTARGWKPVTAAA